MISDDDSFLSAYMDGQLDTDQQHRVESALVANPQLAEQLRRLTALRDLVAGLARDASVDVTPQVMERIRARIASPRRFRAFRSWPAGRGRRLAATGILTTAAGVILAISFASHHAPQFHRPHPAAIRAVAPAVAHATSSTTRTHAGATEDAQETRPSSSLTSRSNDVAPGTPPAGREAHISLVDDLTGSVPSRDLEYVRQFLDNPNPRRFFLVRNGHDGQAEQQVESVVDQSTHYGFFKITIPQGIEIDPRHPEAAAVYALLVKPNEIDRLRDQLKAALPNLVEETPVDPGVVTQLADIGQVRVVPPAPLADVLISREDLALRTNVAGAMENTGTPSSQVAQAAAAAGALRGHPLEPIPGKGDGRFPSGMATIARPSEGPGEKMVVLVWVCKPHPG